MTNPVKIDLGEYLDSIHKGAAMTGGISSSQVARDAERQRCLTIITEEIQRAISLLDLCDGDGHWVFDREQVEAGIAALKHVKRLIEEAA
jgi:hypothetical protein